MILLHKVFAGLMYKHIEFALHICKSDRLIYKIIVTQMNLPQQNAWQNRLYCKTMVMKMMNDPTELAYTGGRSSVQRGARNGLEEQTVLLSQISQQLDEYFAMRNLKM